MKDNVKNSNIIKSFNAALKAAGKEELKDDATRQVGNNGYVLGQTFTLTGKVEPVTSVIDGKKQVWLGVETSDGQYLSLQALMGLSSLRGYSLSGEFVQDNGEAAPTKRVEETIRAEVMEGIDASFIGWENIPTRDLYEMAATLEEHPELIQGHTVTYCGVVAREWTAKKAPTGGMAGAYKVGAKRVSTQKLYKLD